VTSYEIVGIKNGKEKLWTTTRKVNRLAEYADEAEAHGYIKVKVIKVVKSVVLQR